MRKSAKQFKLQDRQGEKPSENRTNCICGFSVKKDFRAFPAYNPALSYKLNTGTNRTMFDSFRLGESSNILICPFITTIR